MPSDRTVPGIESVSGSAFAQPREGVALDDHGPADGDGRSSGLRLVDLTLTIDPTMRGVEFETLHTVEEHGWNSRMLHLYSHCGTHMDAQRHFAAGEGTIDRTPLERCLRPAWVVPLADIQPRELITVGHLGRTAACVRPQDALLLRTDWSRHVNDQQYYRDHFPRISRELAQWCVAHQVGLLGVEPPSVADVHDLDEVTAVHRILLEGDIVIVEGLANLARLREERVLFCAAPLKIHGGDGAPCRAFAIEGWPWNHVPPLPTMGSPMAR